jgi:hypothetical protein
MEKRDVLHMLVDLYKTVYSQEIKFEKDLPKFLSFKDTPPYFGSVYTHLESKIREVCGLNFSEENEFDYDLFIDKLTDCGSGVCTTSEAVDYLLSYNRKE